MRTRLILIGATWAAVVGFVVGSAHAQTPTSPGGQFVLSGVVLLEGGRGLAWIQEPSFTGNKVVTVRLGDSVGPYRVTKILTHQVELEGPGGTVSIPLAGLPGAVNVASSTGASSPGASSPGTVQPSAGEMPPQSALDRPGAIIIPRGDPRRNFWTSESMVPTGALAGWAMSQAPQPQTSEPRPATARDVPVPAAAQNPAPSDPATAIIFLRGDPRRDFPRSRFLVGG